MKRPLASAADAYCWRLACRHYENFSVASWLLRGDLRLDLARVYAFCRTTDDFGDEYGAAARAHLQRWRTDVQDLFAGGLPTHPVLVALRATAQRYGLPAQPFLDLIEANLQDQDISTYATWPALRAYCDKSAAPVGRIVLRLFGIHDPAAVPLSDDVCIGLQLANFAQDVSVDAAKGRTYLLQTEIEAGGIAAATRAHCDRARALLASGRELETMAPWPLRLQLALYRRGGLAILDAVERLGCRTERRRPKVSTRARLLAFAHALRETLREARNVRNLGTA